MKPKLMERSEHKFVAEFIPANALKLWNSILAQFMSREEFETCNSSPKHKKRLSEA